MTHCRSASEAFSSRPIVGLATETTVPSSPTIMMPSETAINVRHLCVSPDAGASACGPECVDVVLIG